MERITFFLLKEAFLFENCNSWELLFFSLWVKSDMTMNMLSCFSCTGKWSPMAEGAACIPSPDGGCVPE